MDNKGINVEKRREFKDPTTGTDYFIAAPTSDDVRGADWHYSKIYTKSLIDGITTAAEMMDILMRRGITGPEFEQRQKELTDDIYVKVESLRNADDINIKQELAVEVSRARNELYSWNQRLNGPMSNTCEQIADDARLEFLTSCIVQTADGNRVWEEYSDFLKEKNQSLAMRSRFEVTLYLQGLDSDFFDKTPEAQAIKEVEMEIQSRAKQVMDELEKTSLDAVDDTDKVDNKDTENLEVKPTKSPRKKKSLE